jgi:hypothetical protein
MTVQSVRDLARKGNDIEEEALRIYCVYSHFLLTMSYVYDKQGTV